jgi:lactobin A/cerein 7B family class IIb bacteriocin
MRELRQHEINQVSGGAIPWAGAAIGGFATGAISSGTVAHLNGASWQTTLSSALLGGLAGATGGIATVTTGAIRAVNTIRSVGYGVASGTVTASGTPRLDVKDLDKELES